MDPEDIFNMFFGGGMPGMHGGGGGFHVYTSGFGPGMQFRAARPRQRAQPGAARREAEAPGLAALLQFLPILLIAALSFLKFNDGGEYVRNSMPGEGKYFTLTVRVWLALSISSVDLQLLSHPSNFRLPNSSKNPFRTEYRRA